MLILKLSPYFTLSFSASFHDNRRHTPLIFSFSLSALSSAAYWYFDYWPRPFHTSQPFSMVCHAITLHRLFSEFSYFHYSHFLRFFSSCLLIFISFSLHYFIILHGFISLIFLFRFALFISRPLIFISIFHIFFHSLHRYFRISFGIDSFQLPDIFADKVSSSHFDIFLRFRHISTFSYFL